MNLLNPAPVAVEEEFVFAVRSGRCGYRNYIRNGGTTIWTFDTPAPAPKRAGVLALRFVPIAEIGAKK